MNAVTLAVALFKTVFFHFFPDQSTNLGRIRGFSPFSNWYQSEAIFNAGNFRMENFNQVLQSDLVWPISDLCRGENVTSIWGIKRSRLEEAGRWQPPPVPVSEWNRQRDWRFLTLRIDALNFHDDSPFPVSLWLLGGGKVMVFFSRRPDGGKCHKTKTLW